MEAPETPYYLNKGEDNSLFNLAINKNVRLYFFKNPGIGSIFSIGPIMEIEGTIEKVKVQGQHLLFKCKNDSYIFPIKNISSLKFL